MSRFKSLWLTALAGLMLFISAGCTSSADRYVEAFDKAATEVSAAATPEAFEQAKNSIEVSVYPSYDLTEADKTNIRRAVLDFFSTCGERAEQLDLKVAGSTRADLPFVELSLDMALNGSKTIGELHNKVIQILHENLL